MDQNKEKHCSGCDSWQIESGLERSESEQGTCGNEESPNKGKETMFADGCGTWKPIVLAKPAQQQ